MSDDPLNRARRQLLARTSALLDNLSADDVGGSFRGITPGLETARAKARTSAINTIMRRASDQVATALGVDLGWDMLDPTPWTGQQVRAAYAERLTRVADWLTQQQTAGRDPDELLVWAKYWQQAVAGSDVHQVARDATIAVAGNNPVIGRVERIAEPGACAWCRTMASRGAVYYSEATALSAGHTHCRCEIATVTNPDAIAQSRAAGAEAWRASELSNRSNPFARGKGSAPARPDPDLFKPGARTVEREAAIQAQITSYEQTVPGLRQAVTDGDETRRKALAWQEAKLAELRTELDELRAVLYPPPTPAPAATAAKAAKAAKAAATAPKHDFIEQAGDWRDSALLREEFASYGSLADSFYARDRYFFDEANDLVVVIRRDRKFSQANLEAFLEHAREAADKGRANMPLVNGKPRRIYFEFNGRARGRTNASTHLGGNRINVNFTQLAKSNAKNAAKKADEAKLPWWSVSTTADKPVMRTLVHEMGHNADLARIPGDPGWTRYNMRKAHLFDRWRYAGVDDQATRGQITKLHTSTKVDANGFSLLQKVTDGPTLYARSDQEEMFAEAYAFWHTHDLDSLSALTRSWVEDFAKEFGWR